MPTMKEVCNQGLGKIGSSRVNNLSPAVSTLEIKCATEYPQWKASELQRRRWTFATKLSLLTALLTPVAGDTDGRIYQFAVPADMLRPLRAKNATWVRRGQFIYDYANTIKLEYIYLVPDNEMTDALFVDVLAGRVAIECAETAAQSPSKKRDAKAYYEDCIDVAGRMNAFTLDPQETGGDDVGYTWDNARTNPSNSGG